MQLKKLFTRDKTPNFIKDDNDPLVQNFRRFLGAIHPNILDRGEKLKGVAFYCCQDEYSVFAKQIEKTSFKDLKSFFLEKIWH